MKTPPYLEGMKAFYDGKLFEENPYNLNPFVMFHKEWAKGWAAGHREYELFYGI